MNKREAISKRDEIINGFSKLRSYYADALFSDQDDDPESKFFYVSRFEDTYKEIVNKINEFTDSIPSCEWIIFRDSSLPKNGDTVLITVLEYDKANKNKALNASLEVYSATFDKEHEVFVTKYKYNEDLQGRLNSLYFPLEDVIAWKPLPTPYTPDPFNKVYK